MRFELLELGQTGAVVPGLMTRLDRPTLVAPDGMFDAEPLTVIVSAALGGVPAVEEVEAMSLADVLTATKRTDIADRIKELGAEGMLALTDHREQSKWLFDQWKGEVSVRGELFKLIMEAECVQQLHEWSLIGQFLDRGMAAALSSRPACPAAPDEFATALQAFRTGVASETKAAANPPAGQGADKKAAKKSGAKAGEKPVPPES